MSFRVTQSKNLPRPSGLGDIVAKFAQPIAAAADALLGTKLKNCGGCARRRAWLNRKFPAPSPRGRGPG